ncbi:MAG: hypothetical protein E7159_01065 [Firmicutes bacterium]|nr:hypothetical protein [Bacillota bacterium]
MLDINTKVSKLKRINIDSNVINYLKERLSNLYIKIGEIYQGNIFDLMNQNALEGWCCQTTESAIVFLDDNDYLERGYLTFENIHSRYYHSWICFNYNSVDYVFDPVLNLITKKNYYERLFNTDVLVKIKASELKKELINKITSYKPVECKNKVLKELYDKYKNEEAIMSVPDDITEPLYRNNSGYKMKLNNNKIKELKAHYYY